MEILVLEGDPFHAQQNVGLFQVPGLAVGAADVVGRLAGAACGHGQGVEGVLDQPREAPVVEVAGRREDDPGRRIMVLHVAKDGVAAHALDQRRRTQHRAAEGLFGKGGFLEEIEDHVVGGVVGLVDLLDDDALFAGQFVLVHHRMLQDVGDDVDGQFQVFFKDLGVVRGVFAGRIGVQVAADGLDLLGDLLGVAAFGALEGHVLQQMRHAVDPGVLVAGADLDPGAQRHGLDRVHDVGDDAKAALKFGDLDAQGRAPWPALAAT